MFINKKMSKGHAYYSIDVCERINGKPKNKTVLYLGRIDQLCEKLAAVDKNISYSTKTISNLECGASLSLYLITQKLTLAKVINKYVPKRDQLIDYGSAFEILTIKNCIEPSSLDSTPLWFANSILSSKFKILPEQLNSKNYCNWFNQFTQPMMKQIFEEISGNAITKFKLSKKKIIIDFSNVTTYQKEKSDEQLAQRGKPKDHKIHLRQVNYALAVTLDGIPLTYDTYAGNINDPTEFKVFVDQVIRMIEEKFGPEFQYIFTFDKGMLGKECINPLEERNKDTKKILFVSALRPSMVKNLFNQSYEFKQVTRTQSGRAIEVAEIRYEIYNKEYRTLITYNDEKFEEDFNQFIEKYSEVIFELQRIRKTKLNKPHWTDIRRVKSRINKLISNEFTKGIVTAEVMDEFGKLTLIFKTDEMKLQERINRFGKSVIFTNDEESTKKEIVTRYFKEKNTVELCNKYLKDPNFCNIDPLRCSKDQNINIKVGVCCLSLMTGLLLERQLKRLDEKITIMPAIEQLKQLRVVKTQIQPFNKEITEVTGNAQPGHEYYKFLNLNQLL